MILQCVNCNSQGIIEYHEDKREEICTTCRGNGYIVVVGENEIYNVARGSDD